ncbi:hypothetical protein EBZ39_01280 [bacterium]|nr:hypothetical protein [bacterium]
MLMQLNPPLPVLTTRGPGVAHIVIDYGPEHDLVWVVFLHANGQCWSFLNRDIRLGENITYSRPAPAAFT